MKTSRFHRSPRLVSTLLAVACASAVLSCAQSARQASPASVTPEPASTPKLLSALSPYRGATRNEVDATTLRGRVMCGYQGWFRAKGDGVVNQWHHWSIDPNRVTPQSLTVEMWPDMEGYPASARFPVEGVRNPDGSQAELFSSMSPEAVDLHFQWMEEYGIEGAFVQRFLVDAREPNSLRATGPLAYARDAANRHGRVFSITYDMTGCDRDRLFDALVSDWRFLVDSMRVVEDKRYLHSGGKPVLMIWGFYPDRMSSETASRIIDFFRGDPRYGAFLVGGVPWEWRDATDPAWQRVFRRFDAICPWNTGNYSVNPDGSKKATTSPWENDRAEATAAGMMFVPVAYPGFSWCNLQRARGNPVTPESVVPRRGGAFLWEQFQRAAESKADAVYVAMFDEVDEGTAIFKVTDAPPSGFPLQTYDGMPTDTYLRVTGLGTRLIQGRLADGDRPLPDLLRQSTENGVKRTER